MSIRIISAALMLFAMASAAGAQTKTAGGSGEYDCASNAGIKIDQTQLVNSIDTDKDGKVSKAEWSAIGAQEGIFSHTDKNTDGFMTVQELNDTTPPDAVDSNKDGKLTLPEFKTFLKFCNQSEDSKPAGAQQGGTPQGEPQGSRGSAPGGQGGAPGAQNGAPQK